MLIFEENLLKMGNEIEKDYLSSILQFVGFLILLLLLIYQF